jgi:hypothetical protein
VPLLPTKPDKSHMTPPALISSDRMECNSSHSEVHLKLIKARASFLCMLLVSVGVLLATASLTGTSKAFAATALTQDAPASASALPNISGNWQISWTAAKGGQREATMQLTQNGRKLSGSFQTERGSASLKGDSDGSQISFTIKMRRRQVSFSGAVNGDKMSGTTEQGASWTATRQQ